MPSHAGTDRRRAPAPARLAALQQKATTGSPAAPVTAARASRLRPGRRRQRRRPCAGPRILGQQRGRCAHSRPKSAQGIPRLPVVARPLIAVPLRAAWRRPREQLQSPIKIALYGTLAPLRLTWRRPSRRCRGGPPARAATYAPATVRANRVRPWSSMKSSRSPSAAKAQARNPCAPETKPARLGGPGRYVSEPVPDVA